MERKTQRKDQRDPPIGQSSHGAQQPAKRNQQSKIHQQPHMFGGQRSQSGERPHDQRGKRCDRYQSDEPVIQRTMVLLALQPDPFIQPGGVGALVRNPRRQIVIRKIGIQLAPCPRHGVYAQIKQCQQQHAAFQPADDAMILNAMIQECVHHSSSQDQRSTIVTGLSLHGHNTCNVKVWPPPDGSRSRCHRPKPCGCRAPSCGPPGVC